MYRSIANVRIAPSEHRLRLEWQMVISQGTWVFPFDTLVVRLYCDPFPDFGRPVLLHTDIDDFQVTRTRSGGINAGIFGGQIGRETVRKAFRPGMPTVEAETADPFYPLYFDLTAIRITVNNGTGLLGVEWEVKSNWWDKPFRCWAQFGYIIPSPGFSVGEYRVEHQEPQSYEHIPMGHASTTADSSASFSSILKEQLARAHRTIDELTKEQYRILEFLHGHGRAAINGCAGSGKTLLAIEKAIRLDRAGHRTLILCHNPHLAKYIRRLTEGTRIVVQDFVAWIRETNHADVAIDTDWTRYQEVSEDELTEAFDNIIAYPIHQYDAVIVDEGQDFKEDWWIVVEAALTDPLYSTFYVFYDDNQKLLRHLSDYPLLQAPFRLDRNCRNTGQVFSLVKTFHPQAPEVSLRWGKEGVVRKWVYSPDTVMQALEEATRAALETVALEELVVLTTELGSSEQSILHTREVHVRPELTWQHEIQTILQAEFSDGFFPSETDIENVLGEARQKLGIYPGRDYVPPLANRRVRWDVDSDGVCLMVQTPTGYVPFREFNRQYRQDFPVYEEAILRFLSNSDWAQDIPGLKPIQLLAQSDTVKKNTIRLSTVASYKGLEADGIVLFVISPVDDLEPMLYVGTSRARFLLHIVLDPVTNTRFHQLDGLDLS